MTDRQAPGADRADRPGSWGPNPEAQPGTYPPPSYTPIPSPHSAPLPPLVSTEASGRLPYAAWSRRVGAYLVDFLPNLIGAALLSVGYTFLLVDLVRAEASTGLPDLTRALIPSVVGLVFLLVGLGWQVYSRWVLGGRTGQSVGKRVFRLMLVSQDTGRPVGVLNAAARDFLHILDSMAYVGYLWPLWDEHRQTFADKIIRTIVLDRAADGASPPDGGPHH